MAAELIDGMGKHPYAALVISTAPIDTVIKEAKRIAKGGDVILALKESRGIEERLLPAYINAYLRYSEKSMHSSSISLEMLLFVAGAMNISNAAKNSAADSKRFILFSSEKKLAEQLQEKCGIKVEKELKLGMDPDAASDVAMTAIRDDK